MWGSEVFFLVPVVQTMNSAILRINHSPADKYQGNQFRYPLDRDLSDGYRYPPFEQLGPQSCFRPRKLLYVYRVYNEDQSFNNFENDTMTLSVNEAKLVCELGTVLLFNNFDFKICPRARTVSEPCERGALVAYSVYVSGQNDQQTENLSKQMVILAPTLSVDRPFF